MLGNVLQKMHQAIYTSEFKQGADWESTLSGMTEMELLSEMRRQLADACSVKSKNLVKKIEFILGLDEKVYPKVQNLTRNYLKSMSKNIELRKEVEDVTHAYLRQLYITYSTVIAEYQQNNKSVLTKEKINLLLSRYLNAAFLMSKWRYFDDQPAPLGLWKNVHKVIRIAEELSIMNKELFLYDFQHKETSLAIILKRGFMLDTLQKGSYTQLQIELTDRILKTWSTNPIITDRYTKQREYQFFIHLDEDNRPQRIRGAKQHPDFRYWRTTDIVDLIESYLCAVDTRKPLDKFNLLTMAATEDIVSLFKKLRVDWCVKGYKRQRRGDERATKFNMLNVNHGINEIGERIRRIQKQPKNTNNAYAVDSLELVSAEQHTTLSQLNSTGRENWVMLEESKRGFSVELGKEVSPWVKTGGLICYSTVENAQAIALAEIKTVRKRANGTHRVGLLKMTNNATALSVKAIVKGAPFAPVAGHIVNDGEESLSFSDEFTGLFIGGELHQRPQLIVPRYQFKRAGRYKVNINGDSHTILAGEVVSNHREWVCFDMIV